MRQTGLVRQLEVVGLVPGLDTVIEGAGAAMAETPITVATPAMATAIVEASSILFIRFLPGRRLIL